MRVPVWFYNLRVGRNRHQVESELRAILSTEPAVLGLCESVGYRLPHIDGYRLIRDDSTPGRADVAAYVRDDLPVTRIKWTDCRTTWKRPKGKGQHPARSILSFRAAGMRAVVHHQPPRWVDAEYAGQREGNRKVARIMAPWRWRTLSRTRRQIAKARPRVAVMDANRTARDTGPGPAVLARRVRGTVVPATRIDVAVICGEAEVLEWSRPNRVAGVRLRSDHPHALRVILDIPSKWLTSNR